MTGNAFDHERDTELGALLRTHLEPAGHAAFVARVRASLAAEVAPGPFEILGAWMRPGIAAAAIIALAAGWWMVTVGTPQTVASTTPVEVFAAGGGSEVMLATSVEDR
jgi:hypothetical protein